MKYLTIAAICLAFFLAVDFWAHWLASLMIPFGNAVAYFVWPVAFASYGMFWLVRKLLRAK